MNALNAQTQINPQKFNTLSHWLYQNVLGRKTILAIMNGVFGDVLADSQHPLAIQMHFRLKSQPWKMDQPLLTSPFYGTNNKIIILVHGLCMLDLPWSERLAEQDRQDESALEHSFLGYTPISLCYNSGRHISTNGQEFAQRLESLVAAWPTQIQELVIIGFSMGGLVSRSACHYASIAGHQWLKKLTKIIFIATPHHGAPLERYGNWLDSMLSVTMFTSPLAKLGKIRSAGITDLRYGNLLDSDWQGLDRFAAREDCRQPVALPDGVHCHVLAATHGKRAGDLGDRMLGDGLVPLDSALGRHIDPAHCLEFAPSNQWIGYGMSHLALLKHPDSIAKMKAWLMPEGQKGSPISRSLSTARV